MSIFKRFNKKPEPIVINDELGTFTLKNPEKDKFYDGTVNWLGVDVGVSLRLDSSDSLTADITLKNLHEIVAQAADWDKKLRQYAVEDMCDEDGLIEIWGDWDEEDEASPITKEEFLSRISLGFMHVYPNDEIYFDYDLDGMFTDHGLGIFANTSGEILSSGLQG